MALINKYYVFVKDEDVARSTQVSEHPVEKGLPLTDHVRKEPMVISLTGEIVGKNAATVLENIDSLRQKGTLVKYVGRNVLSNAIITKFDTTHPYTIKGGCEFTAEIKEIRIAKSPYTAPAKEDDKKTPSAGNQQVTEKEKPKRYHTVKPGDCLWSLAASYYGNGAQYMKIFNANRDKIKDPDLIYDGDKLVIPY